MAVAAKLALQLQPRAPKIWPWPEGGSPAAQPLLGSRCGAATCSDAVSMGSGLVKARQSCYRTTSVVQSGCTTRDSELCNLVAQSRSCAIWLHNLSDTCAIWLHKLEACAPLLHKSRVAADRCPARSSSPRKRSSVVSNTQTAEAPSGLASARVMLAWAPWTGANSWQQLDCAPSFGCMPVGTVDSPFLAKPGHSCGLARCRRSSGPDWRPHSPTNRRRAVLLGWVWAPARPKYTGVADKMT